MSARQLLSANLTPGAPLARPHLDYLYGIRGLAALWVVTTHFMLSWGVRSDNLVVRLYRHVVMDGTLAIALFIAMSGFLLAMPAALNQGELPGGARSFVSRRARRLLPPYLVAYIGYLALYPLVAWLGQMAGFRLSGHFVHELATYYTPSVVLSHLLLVFNLSAEWVGSSTGILWTIPVEWHLYLVFALVLHPASRRLGWGMTLLLVMLGTAALHTAHVKGWLFYHQAWFAPVFMLGALAAHISFSPLPPMRRLHELPWGWISFALVLGAGAILHWLSRDVPPDYTLPTVYGVAEAWRWIPDLATGTAFSSVMVWLARASMAGPDAGQVAQGVLRFMGLRWLVLVGRRSYSLYLTHGAVIICLHHLIRPRARLWVGDHVLILLSGLALCALATWLFYAGVERHFLPDTELAGESHRAARGARTGLTRPSSTGSAGLRHQG